MTTDQPYQSDLEYLEDELEWIELRCKRIITKRLVEDMSADDEAGVYYNQSYYGHHDQSIEALIAKRDHLEKQERKLRLRIDTRLGATRQSGRAIAVDTLVELYGLNEFERTVLLMAASVTFSRRFLQLFGRIWNGYEALIVETVFSFCELSFSERITHLKQFSHQGALFRHELVSLNFGNRIQSPQELLDAQLRISNRTFDFIVGDDHFMDEFMEFSSVEEPRARFEQVVLDSRDKQRIRSVVERHDTYLARRAEWGFDEIISYGKGILMLFYGKPGTGKTMMAHAVAHEMGMRVLNVDIPTFINHYDAQRFLPALFREAKMQNAILFFDECEALFATRAHGNPLMTMLLTEIERFEGVAILATNLPQQLDEALDRRILVRVNFPEPDRQARRDIWATHLPEKAPVAPDVDLDVLADRYEMAGGYIKNAVLMAVAEAVHEGGDDPKITMAALEQAAREQTMPSNQADAPVVMPQTQLDDVVLPESQAAIVREFVAAARTRRTALERARVGTHLGYGKNVAARFIGPTGTGKTLCAEAVANALNRPLRIESIAVGPDVDRLQWRNRVQGGFDDARIYNAVLALEHGGDLFEAANVDLASWLASVIERHDGVVILDSEPTAAQAALDSRFQFVVEFPAARDAETRGRILRSLLRDAELSDVDVDQLAREFDIHSGATLRDAVFDAAFRASRDGARLSTDTLRGALRERTR